jgi:hypothetical protein
MGTVGITRGKKNILLVEFYTYYDGYLGQGPALG